MAEKGIDDKTDQAQSSGGIDMSFTLPAWRMREIMDIAGRILCEAKYYAEGFDYRQMIRNAGIVIKGYSQFLPENLEKMRAFSKSFWTEGLCMVCPPDNESGEGVKMICYNDSYENGEEIAIILHEFGHILLKHTEQSMNGEAEAICFATSVMLIISFEERFHITRGVANGENFGKLLQQIQDDLDKEKEEL